MGVTMILTDKIGNGQVKKLPSGAAIFQLDSYKENPVVKPQDIGLIWEEEGKQKIGAVFNGGAEIYDNRIVLLPRCHHHYRKTTFFDEQLGRERTCLENYISEVWVLISDDGIHFNRYDDIVIRGDGSDHQDFLYGIEDIRIIRYPDYYLLVGCGKIKPPFKGSNADRTAIYSTTDFQNITYHGMISAFDGRNTVPFPEPIHGTWYTFLRFHPNIHLAPLEGGIEQLLNPKKYQNSWEKIYNERAKNLFIQSGMFPHEKEKVGPGTQIIKTEEGWLFIYHAVGEIGEGICQAYGLTGRIERGYSICAALLDLDNPQKIIARTRKPIYIPHHPYELYGTEEKLTEKESANQKEKYSVDVPAVVFPVGAVTIQDKLLIYAGAGDKYTVLLGCHINDLLDYLLTYCKI